jgi:hypothetical protein
LVIDMVHDGEEFSNYAIKNFHELTDTKPNDEIYRRTSSRDMNRLRRIIDRFDQAIDGNVPSSDLSHVRRQIIHDLAGLARANPDEPEIANIFHVLPRDRIPNLPSSPLEAIAINETEFETEFEHKIPSPKEPEPKPSPRRPRNRFYKEIVLPKRQPR